MTEPRDPLKVIASAAAKRAEAEAVLKTWIPRAYQSGVPILRIARAANITRAAVYGRLETAGVAGTVVKASRWHPTPDIAPGRVDEPDPVVVEGPEELNGWAEPVDVVAPVAAAVAYAQAALADPEPGPPADGRHAFEAAVNEYGELLMICKTCQLRAENGAHT